MQDVIRTIVRERMDEQSVVRSRIQVKAIVRNGIYETAIVRNEIFVKALVRNEQNEISIVYTPAVGTVEPSKPTFHYLSSTPFNDRWTGLPPVLFDYFKFR